MKTGLFITSSGTEIGKTYVTSLLCRQLRNAGKPVDAIKPVVSGFAMDQVRESDPGQLLAALDRPLEFKEVEKMSPWRFSAALSPDMAAEREGRKISLDEVSRFSRSSLHGEGVLLVEGVGGVMAPLCHDAVVVDWIAATGLPALLVVGSYLGTISHSLTACEALTARGIRVAGIVISPSKEQPVLPEETAGAIARFVRAVPISILERLPLSEWRRQPDLTHVVDQS